MRNTQQYIVIRKKARKRKPSLTGESGNGDNVLFTGSVGSALSMGPVETLRATSGAEKRLSKRRQIVGKNKITRGCDLEDRVRALDLAKIPESEIASIANNHGYASFQRLEAAALAVAPGTTIEEVEEAMGDDFLVTPNIALHIGLPGQNALAPTTDLKPEMRTWPNTSGIAKAHANGNYGKDVIVGVLDTGIDADHKEFAGQDIPFFYAPLSLDRYQARRVRGFDPGGHGTHVSGIIAGANRGIAPEAELAVASVIESETTTTSLARIVLALDWFLELLEEPQNVEKTAVLNLSLGFYPGSLDSGGGKTLAAIKEILGTLLEFDVLSLVAIGNEGPHKARAPGIYPEVLGIGAVDDNLALADFSGSDNGKPDLMGFGVDVWSSYERDMSGKSLYRALRGTSMATPYVAGIAALLASEKEGLAGEDLRKALLDASLPLGESGSILTGQRLARYVKQ